jgi:hypothetical protein
MQLLKYARRALSSLISSTLLLEAIWSLLIDGTIITDIQSNPCSTKSIKPRLKNFMSKKEERYEKK